MTRKRVRPQRIIITYFDPLGDVMLCESNFSYDARLSSEGFYSNGIEIMKKGLKKFACTNLGVREPVAKVRLVWA